VEEATVFGAIELGDMTGLKEIKDVLPAASGVRVRIDKASIKDNSFEGSVPTKKYLNLQLRIVDGISFVDAQGEAQTKYKNKCIFTNAKDLPVWVDTNHEFYKGEKFVKGAYLIPLRQFLISVGVDPKAVKIDEALLMSLTGTELEVDIAQNQKKSKVVGEDGSESWVASGVMENLFRNWKKA
jgi:hypothetical protein